VGLNRELEGITVIALEQAVAAPYCSLLLADAGARVIKVERPEGDFSRKYDQGADGQSAWFAWMNRGKESVVVNLDEPDDDALLRRMIGAADVFLHNLVPGALDRRGLGNAALRALNPGLVHLQIAGYGSSGEAAGMKAYDFLVQAESGVCAVTGTPDEPARVGISVSDLATGLTGFSAVLRALIQRGRTGEGTDLTVSMFDVMADWMNMPLLSWRYTAAKPERLGLTHALLAPYGAYECACGNKILIAIQNDREWARFCSGILQRSDLAQDGRFSSNTERVRNRIMLDREVNRVFNAIERDKLAETLQKAGIAWARLNSLEDLSNHVFLRQIEARFGSAVVEMADLPVRTEGARPLQVPGLGQHSQAIREEFRP